MQEAIRGLSVSRIKPQSARNQMRLMNNIIAPATFRFRSFDDTFVAGKPVDNCIIYLVNKDMRLVPQGEIGELIVAGRNLAAGYIRGRDAHKFVDNLHAIDPGEGIK